LHSSLVRTTPVLGSDRLRCLDALSPLYAKQMLHLLGRQKDAIASSDITKAPFVKR